MSKEEFEKYRNGQILINNTVHEAKTNSVGFCFMNCDEYTPEEAMHFLSGIVTFDVCVVFETEENLNKSYGVYAKPIKPTGNILEDLINLYNNFTDSFKANEYCITEYSNKTMKLLKYSKEIWKQWKPAEEQSKLKWECDTNEDNTER